MFYNARTIVFKKVPNVCLKIHYLYCDKTCQFKQWLQDDHKSIYSILECSNVETNPLRTDNWQPLYKNSNLPQNDILDRYLTYQSTKLCCPFKLSILDEKMNIWKCFPSFGDKKQVLEKFWHYRFRNLEILFGRTLTSALELLVVGRDVVAVVCLVGVLLMLFLLIFVLLIEMFKVMKL
jgi:hypothetical protein